MMNSEGQSLETLIKKSSQEFLELRVKDALATLQQGIRLCVSSNPYRGQEGDLREMAALELIFSEELQATQRILDERIYRADEIFLKYLPERLKLRLASAASTKVLALLKDFPAGTMRVSRNGSIQTFPMKLEIGRHLVHLHRNNQLEAGWLSVEPSKFSYEKLWTRNTPNLKVDRAVRPIDLTTLNLDPPLVNFESGETEIVQEFKIWKSPWFWVATAAIAGLAGYGIYEATHQTKVIRTP